MKIEFEVSCLGYSVGGYNNPFEMEIDDNEIEGMSEDERMIYIEEVIGEYINQNLDFGYEIKE